MSDTLKITLLGTGIPNPDTNAFGTSTLIEAGDEVVMLECGRGAVIRLHECMYVPAATKLCEALAQSKPTLWDHLSASHTTCEDVGRIATQAGCKHLVLNHYVSDVGQWSTLDDFTQAAGTTFNGKITAGRDLLEIPF